VRGTRFQMDDVRLLHLDLLRVFYDGDALAVRDEARQHVEERCLAAAGASGNDYVELRPDEGVERLRRDRRQGTLVDEAAQVEDVLREAADGNIGPLGRGGRNDGLEL